MVVVGRHIEVFESLESADSPYIAIQQYTPTPCSNHYGHPYVRSSLFLVSGAELFCGAAKEA